MFPSAQKGPGDIMGRITTTAWNRCGSTIYKGQVVMADVASSETETDSTVQGDEGYALGNVIDQTDANMNLGHPLYVCLDDSIADNKPGKFVVWGQCEVATLADNVSTTDVDAGDPLGMVNSEGDRAVQAARTTDGGGDRRLGLALEDAIADTANGVSGLGNAAGTVNASLETCLWTGGAPGYGANQPS